MELEQLLYMVETRIKAAKQKENTTELSFLYELNKAIEELKQIKEPTSDTKEV